MPLLPDRRQTLSDDVDVAYHQSIWTAHTDGRRTWHAVIDLVQHTQLDDVRRGMSHGPWASQKVVRRRVWHVSVPLDNTHVCPLGSKHCKTTSGKAYHHRPWTTYKVRRRRAWHVIIDLGLYTRSEDVGRGNAIISIC